MSPTYAAAIALASRLSARGIRPTVAILRTLLDALGVDASPDEVRDACNGVRFLDGWTS